MDIQPELSLFWIGALLEGALIGIAGFGAFVGFVWFLTALRQELRNRKALVSIIRFEDGRSRKEKGENDTPEGDLGHVSAFRSEVKQLRSRPSH